MPETRIVTVTLNPAVDRVIEAPGFGVGKRTTGRVVAWYPAGKGLTISRVLATLGVRSIATGFVGRQELAMFEEHLEHVGGGRAVVQFLVVRARTRDNITIVDPIDDTETHVRDEGFSVQPDDVKRIASKLAMLARENTIMCFGGSLPGGVSTEQFAQIVARCAGQGARIVIDTNEDGLRALRGRRAWIVKFSSRQLRAITGRDVGTVDEVLAAARSLTVAEGGAIDYVLATRGADGAVLVGTEAELVGRVSVHPGRIVSTVGSGESLLGGFLSAWLATKDWSAALREGLALATANAVGREAGLVMQEDIEEFRAMSTVEPAG